MKAAGAALHMCMQGCGSGDSLEALLKMRIGWQLGKHVLCSSLPSLVPQATAGSHLLDLAGVRRKQIHVDALVRGAVLRRVA
jgi:hypothetical protein